MSSTFKKIGQATDAKTDVARAEKALQEILEARELMEAECNIEVDRISTQFSPENLVLDSIEIPPRKTDTRIKQVSLVWVPWQIDPNGIATPLIDLPESYRQMA